MKERYKSTCAVFLVLTRMNNNKEEVLLHKRQNTGYMDGKYEASCSGHLDPDESVSTAVIREAREELGITIRERDLKFEMVVHDFEDNYIRFFFKADKYEGLPTIIEPKKCSELKWVLMNNLPEDMIPHIKLAIEDFNNGQHFDDGSRVKMGNHEQ